MQKMKKKTDKEINWTCLNEGQTVYCVCCSKKAKPCKAKALRKRRRTRSGRKKYDCHAKIVNPD